MGQKVQRFRTNISDTAFRAGLKSAWRKLFKTEPTDDQINLIMAQNDLETAHRRSMWNYNVGNITTDGKGSYNYFDDLTTKEQMKPGQWKTMNLKYRAYDSMEQGIEDYLKFLGQNKRYGNAWQHILNPDPVAFSKALKQSKYYTANESAYTNQISKLYDSYSKGKTKTNVIPFTAKNTSKEKSLDEMLEGFLKMVAASNKEMYNLLPEQVFSIIVTADTHTIACEFGQILKNALDEELESKSYVHTDGAEIEVECSIHGGFKETYLAVKEVSAAIKSLFKTATEKVGAFDVGYDIKVGYSVHDKISLALAEKKHDLFLQKFAELS